MLMGPAVPLALSQSHISHDLNPPTEDLPHDSLSASCSATCHLGDCLTDPMALLATTHCLQLNTGSPLDPTPHDPPLVTGGLSLQPDSTSNEPTSDHPCSSETADLSHVDQAYRLLPLCDNPLSPSVDSEVDLSPEVYTPLLFFSKDTLDHYMARPTGGTACCDIRPVLSPIDLPSPLPVPSSPSPLLSSLLTPSSHPPSLLHPRYPGPSPTNPRSLMSSSDLAPLLHRRCLTDISPRPPTTSPLSSLPPCPPSPPPPSQSISHTHQT